MQDEGRRMDPTTTITTAATSRRTVLQVGGGATAAAVLAALSRGGLSAAAQEASPEASPAAGNELEGRYVAIRERVLAAGNTSQEVLATISEGFVPLVTSIEGFVAYLGIADPASPQTAYITVCEDKAGTDESTTVGAAWLTDNGYEFFEGDPIIIEGPIGIALGTFPSEVATLDTDAEDAATPADATPAAGDEAGGVYVVIRSRKLKPDRSGEELLELVREGFVPRIESAPGLVAYLAVFNDETRDQFAVGVYTNRAEAEESTRLAAEFAAEGAGDYTEGDPIVIEGIVGIAAAAANG